MPVKCFNNSSFWYTRICYTVPSDWSMLTVAVNTKVDEKCDHKKLNMADQSQGHAEFERTIDNVPPSPPLFTFSLLFFRAIVLLCRFTH